jgi:hypothetical protein
MLDTSSKSGYHFRKPSAQFQNVESWHRDVFDGPGEWLRKGGKKVGQQKIGNMVCDVYRRTERSKGVEGISTLFLSSEKKLPVRIQTVGTLTFGQKKTNFRTVMTFKKWHLNKQMADTLFQPPSDFRIRN